jgi:hypothetical protein
MTDSKTLDRLEALCRDGASFEQALAQIGFADCRRTRHDRPPRRRRHRRAGRRHLLLHQINPEGTKPVKTLSMIVVATLFSTASYAGQNESPIRGKGPFSVVRNGEPGISHGVTVDQINKSLEAAGKPPLGSIRTLYDDHAGWERKEIIVRH